MTLPLLALVAALAGCSAEAGTSAGAESVDGVQAAAAAEQAKPAVAHGGMRGHRGPGPDFLVHAALRAPLDLSAEQKATIEGLVKAPREHAEGAAHAAHAAKLAAAIRSNSLEAAPKPAPKPEIDESARQARNAASAKSLQTLHDTLTAQQRATLIDGLATRAAAHEAHRPDGAERQGVEARGGHGGPMAFLRGLDLTQEQKDALKAKFEAQRPAKPSEEERQAMKASFASMRAEMKAKLESFKGDKFDATAFVTPPANRPQMARRPMNGLAIVTSVLTPAQRETLAARIEKGPAMRTVRPAGE